MSLPMAQVHAAKFTHEETGTGLRLQTFVLVRDEKRRVACFQLDGYAGAWCLPGETMRLNESPDEAARRIEKTWLESPLENVRLARVESYPATGPEDNKWYLLFVYEATAKGTLKGTPDTLKIEWAEPGKAPGAWAMSHADVWARVK